MQVGFVQGRKVGETRQAAWHALVAQLGGALDRHGGVRQGDIEGGAGAE